MAVLIEDVFPVGVTIELLDAITDEMGVDGNLSPGGVMRAHCEKDGRGPEGASHSAKSAIPAKG